MTHATRKLDAAPIAWLVLAVLAMGSTCFAKHYKPETRIPLIANKVGPLANPSETYPYYSLPFCRDESVKSQSQQLGEVLSGDRKVSTMYNIRFMVDESSKLLCERPLSMEDVAKFAEACEEDYYFEMYFDDLPIWGYIGEHEHEDLLLGHTEQSRHYLYTHLHFSIGYNHDQIVEVNVTTDPSRRLDITTVPVTGLTAEFTYSVKWIPSAQSFKHRMDKYTQYHFLPRTLEIHWLSIMNSVILVLLLTVFLAIILLRILRNDFSRYTQADADPELVDDEVTGWKLVHGDVFRFPRHKSLLAAAVGVGAHLFVVTIMLLSLTVLGLFEPNRRGSVLTACLVTYSLTSSVGGYVSARLFAQMKGENWVWNAVLTAFLFPAPLSTVFMFVNSTAVAHSSTAALPFGTILVVMAMFSLVSFPLTVIGSIAGRNTAGFDPPCRTYKVPRPIPQPPCYLKAPVQIVCAGFLPFSAISFEMHYIFASVWGHKVYTLFGILYFAFVLLAIVTSFIVIALTYFQLSVENYHWWWRSFACGGMVGAYIYAYCIFYYHNHSEMTGFLQSSFYFGYMAIASYGFFLMLGFIGFFSASYFVRFIFSRVKID